MPNGGVVRIATTARRASGASHVELSVADRGPGVSDADLPHIFEPFYTTRGDAGGTGLGLATVLGTAEQHGGTVRVEPRPGGGSVFTLVLPAADLRSDRPTLVSEPGSVRGEASSLRLLVIDDEPMIADVTRRMLVARGHSVLVARSPDEALAIWAEHGATVDLVICDVVMAQMRGPELVTRLAQLGAAPRVLFITGYSEEAVRSELSHPVLAKPFTAAALWRAIGQVLGCQSRA
jgi:two-component system, cell cycle sensor histidine kinase and response regulator CckA